MSTRLVNHATIDSLHEMVDFDPPIVVQEHMNAEGEIVDPSVGEIIANAIAREYEHESIYENARRIDAELLLLIANGEVARCNEIIGESVAAQGVVALITEIPEEIPLDTLPGPHLSFAA